jgi:5-enolpyruvylshikimate-3-phosphate synthase
MLAGLIAPHPHTFTLIGDHSLTMRPMERIRKPLSQMGARIDLVDGHAPMTIHGGPLKAIDFTTPIPSAQVKTAVLFAGLQAGGTTSLAEAIRTRDHSEHALKAFGATLPAQIPAIRQRSPSPAAKNLKPSTPPFLVTSRPQPSFSAPRCSFQTRISCSIRSA